MADYGWGRGIEEEKLLLLPLPCYSKERPSSEKPLTWTGRSEIWWLWEDDIYEGSYIKCG